MSYEPTNWKTGDVVTSQKLNKLEQGVAGANSGGSFAPDITDPQDGDTLVYNAEQQKWVNGAGAGGVLVVHVDEETNALDKTWKEIYDAIMADCLVIGHREVEIGTETQFLSATHTCWTFIDEEEQTIYGVTANTEQTVESYITNSEDGYPIYHESD